MKTTGDDFVRQLPFSLEAEQSVLGSILIDPDCFNDIVSIIKTDDFYLEEHRQIYTAMQDLYLQNRTIDVVTLIDALVKRGVYESDENGRRYIKLIAEIVPGSSNVSDYAHIVRDKSILRQIIEACSEITDTAYSEQDDIQHIIDSAEQRIFSIAEGSTQKGFVHIREAMLRVYDHLKLLKTDKEAAVGTQTGFSDLDRVLVGMGEGDLVLV
ncbi:MAG: DnaB-like helicase N-terminal domain-containing protein, partial [Firmicutes bacterium]|nr:DnaB-like helicase N-terminal domain-containing protein [Bacillota bacterium]